MASSIFLSFFLLFSLSFFSSAKSDANLIEQVCSFSSMDFEGCKSTLASDPNSLKVDEIGILNIFLNKIKTLAVESLAYTDKKIKSTAGDADTQAAYETCHDLWETTGDRIDKTIKGVAEKDLNEAEDAYNQLDEGYQCTNHFLTSEFRDKKDEMYNKINQLYRISYYVNNIWTSLRNKSLKTTYKIPTVTEFSPSG